MDDPMMQRSLFLSLITLFSLHAEEVQEAPVKSRLEQLVEDKRDVAARTMQWAIALRRDQLQRFKRELEQAKASLIRGEQVVIQPFAITKPNTMRGSSNYLMYVDADVIRAFLLIDIQQGNTEQITTLINEITQRIEAYATKAEKSINTAYAAFLDCQNMADDADEGCYTAFENTHVPAFIAQACDMQTHECEAVIYRMVGSITLDEVKEAKVRDKANS